MASTTSEQHKVEEAETKTAEENHEDVSPVEQSSYGEDDVALPNVTRKITFILVELLKIGK